VALPKRGVEVFQHSECVLHWAP